MILKVRITLMFVSFIDMIVKIVFFIGHFEASLQKSWTREKRKILENMGHHSTTSSNMGYNMDLGMQLCLHYLWGGTQISNATL